MRKRWRERFSRNRATDEDSPTSMPVSVPDAEELSDAEGDAMAMQHDLFGGSFDFDFWMIQRFSLGLVVQQVNNMVFHPNHRSCLSCMMNLTAV